MRSSFGTNPSVYTLPSAARASFMRARNFEQVAASKWCRKLQSRITFCLNQTISIIEYRNYSTITGAKQPWLNLMKPPLITYVSSEAGIEINELICIYQIVLIYFFGELEQGCPSLRADAGKGRSPKLPLLFSNPGFPTPSSDDNIPLPLQHPFSGFVATPENRADK